MNSDRLQDHPFWGRRAPLATLAGIVLLIFSSGRTAYALVVLGALLWHHSLLILALNAARPVFPQKGRAIAEFFLSGVLNSTYILFLFLLNPFLALETFLYCLLVPVYSYVSRLPGRLENSEVEDAVIKAAAEALSMGVLIVALALIREPLGYGSLSLPGGSGGIVRLFVSGESPYFPIRIFAGSAGALILLGYGAALFNRLREFKSMAERDSE
ncbi:MAG: hypothetical protein LBI91_03375 [Spirochaetaceae bacterium]|nr:hypothetical protein [Spirochaetaceae bacterium]